MPSIPFEGPPSGGRSQILSSVSEATSNGEHQTDEKTPESSTNEDGTPLKAPRVSGASPRDEEEQHQSIRTQPGVVDVEGLPSGPRLPDVDPYAPRLGVGAEIWKTYVEEADKWDKELSDGWNKMLDVILIFAALFSAISTAFVLESSKDLKPDPTESSSAALQTMTQILLIMSNQSTSTTIALPAKEPSFSPSTSAVVVNVLWFMSLILSVAVTLIAMLAKEWCHLFMGGRTGHMHEQARQRQLRLEGLKRWKMEGVIPALPTLMHLALFLFAAGLCVYLWDIHIGVAIPVVLISAVATVLYLSAIVLPFIHDHCPYETALSKLLKPWVQAWARVWFVPNGSTTLWKSNLDVPMDLLTSRVLSWLVTNCENPKAVEIALKSIAGADHTLPCGPLLECNSIVVIIQHIQDCFSAHQLLMERDLALLEELSPEQHSSAIIYARSLNVLASHLAFCDEMYAESQHQVRSCGDSLISFYNCLEQTYPNSIASVGATGCALVRRMALAQTQYPHEIIEPYPLSRLVRSAQKEFSELHNHTCLLSEMFHTMSQEISILNRIGCHPQTTDPEVRVNIIKTTLEVLSCIPLATLQTAPVSQFVAVTALKLNKHLLAHFETSDASLLPLFNNRPAGIVEHRRTRIENLSASSLLVLGLIGLVEAYGDVYITMFVQQDELTVVFQRLYELDVNWGDLEAFFPLVPTDMFDLRRYAIEIVYKYYYRRLTCNATLSLSSCVSLLSSMTAYKWVDMSWITDLVLNTLARSNSDEMCGIAANFLYDNPDSIIRHPQVYNFLYDMFRISKHKSPWRFHWDQCISLRPIVDSFQTIAPTNGNDSENTESAINALLERLVNNDLLFNLMVSAFESDEFKSKDEYWQGLSCGQTTRFWVERIIALGRKSNNGQAASNDDNGSTTAARIREFCVAPRDLPVEAKSSDEHGKGSGREIPAYLEQERSEWEEDLRRYLVELKRVILREIDGSPVQPASTQETQQHFSQDVRPIMHSPHDQPNDQSHIVIHVPEGAGAEDSPTPSTNV